MKKRNIVAGLIVMGVSLMALTVKLHGPVSEAKRSCHVLRTFANHIHRAEWAEAQAMLQTDPEWCRIENGKMLYWNHDITDCMASAQPKFWKTLEYYLTDRHMGDKVIFQASSRADYATLKDGKITFIKIP
ncbi:MAG: hypothetical protein WC440_05615 [Candidatus Omnitrophota bacterium]|jgi:hypothetical protein